MKSKIFRRQQRKILLAALVSPIISLASLASSSFPSSFTKKQLFILDQLVTEFEKLLVKQLINLFHSNRADTGAKRRGSSSCWEPENTDEEESSWCRAAWTTWEETGSRHTAALNPQIQFQTKICKEKFVCRCVVSHAQVGSRSRQWRHVRVPDPGWRSKMDASLLALHTILLVQPIWWHWNQQCFKSGIQDCQSFSKFPRWKSDFMERFWWRRKQQGASLSCKV